MTDAWFLGRVLGKAYNNRSPLRILQLLDWYHAQRHIRAEDAGNTSHAFTRIMVAKYSLTKYLRRGTVIGTMKIQALQHEKVSVP